MKKIFILTGEPSGDKLASAVISKFKENNPDDLNEINHLSHYDIVQCPFNLIDRSICRGRYI